MTPLLQEEKCAAKSLRLNKQNTKKVLDINFKFILWKSRTCDTRLLRKCNNKWQTLSGKTDSHFTGAQIAFSVIRIIPQ